MVGIRPYCFGFVLALGWTAATAQSPPEDYREMVPYRLAQALRERAAPVIGHAPVVWALAVDISKSAFDTGTSDSVATVIGDFSQSLFVAGDRVLLVPFDNEPCEPEVIDLTALNRDSAAQQLTARLQPRMQDGEWRKTSDLCAGLVRAAALMKDALEVPELASHRGLLLLLSDRANQDQAICEDSLDGFDTRGADPSFPSGLLPLSHTIEIRDADQRRLRSVPLFAVYAISKAEPNQAAVPIVRLMPRKPATITRGGTIEYERPVTRRPPMWWFGGLFLVVGAVLALFGLRSANQVRLRWGSIQNSYASAIGPRFVIRHHVGPSAVDMRSRSLAIERGGLPEDSSTMIREDLATAHLEPSQVLIQTTEGFTVNGRTEEVISRNGAPVTLKFVYSDQNRNEWQIGPEGGLVCSYTDRHRNWQSLAVGGGVMAVLGLVLLATNPAVPVPDWFVPPAGHRVTVRESAPRRANAPRPPRREPPRKR